jgi:hypothetical protein
MTAGVKLAAFALALLAAFGGGYGAGALAGPAGNESRGGPVEQPHDLPAEEMTR